MTAVFSIVVWLFASLRLLFVPVSGVLLTLTMFALTPRYLGVGIGDAGFSLSTKRLILLSCLVASIGIYLKSGSRFKIFQTKPVSNLFYLLFTFYLVSCIASFFHSDSIVSYFRFIEDVLILILGLLIASALANHANGSRLLCKYLFLIPLSISTVLVLLELLKGAPLLAGILDLNSSIAIGDKGREFTDVKIRDNRYRAKGLFDGQLMLAEFVLYCFPAIFYANRIRMINTAATVALVVCGVFTLWATGSRGGMVVLLLIGFFLLFCITLKNSRKLVRVVVPTVTFVSILVALVVLYQLVTGLEVVDNFSVIDDRSERSTYGRLLQFQIVSNLVAESPIYGFGYKRNYSDAFEQLFTIDNFYLVSAIQGGLIGLLAFIGAIIYSGLAVFRRAMGKSLQQYYFGVWILGFITAFASMKLFLSQPTNNFYFILVVAFALFKLSENAINQPRKRRRQR